MAIDPAAIGMPSASTTGVQDGITLTPYTGPMEITTPGTVIENQIIDGTLRVLAENVTIKNCSFTNWDYWGVDADGIASVTIEHCDFVGNGSISAAAILGNGNFGYNDISNAENGIYTNGGSSTITNNYIHDLHSGAPDPHYCGIQVEGGEHNLVISNNSVIDDFDSGVFLQPLWGPITDVQIDHNLIVGGSFSLELQQNGQPYTISNVSVTDNVIAKGWWDYYSFDVQPTTFTGNVLWNDDAGDPMPPMPGGTGDLFPSAVDDSASTAYQTPVVVDALANDSLGDSPTSVTSFDATSAHGGSVEFVNGKFTYTPANGWSGPDTFHYALTDSDGDSDGATVTVNVGSSTPPTPGQTLTGTAKGDTLTGGAGDDAISGEGGHDWLYGNAGNDKITGGAGNDDLFGGAGDDTFDFNAINETPPGIDQRDLIHDFQRGVDKIDLSTIDANSGMSGDQTFSFAGEGAFTSAQLSTAGLVKFTQYTNAQGVEATLVEGTVDGASGVDFQIALLGHHALTAGDFTL